MISAFEVKFFSIKNELYQMLLNISLSDKNIYQALSDKNIEKFDASRSILKNMQSIANDIDNKIVSALALYEPEASSLRELVSFLKITSEFVKISDNIRSYSKQMSELVNNNNFPEELGDFILPLHKCVASCIGYLLDILNEENNQKIDDIIRKIIVEEGKSDELFSLFEKELFTQMSEPNYLRLFKILTATRKLERIADCAVNVAKIFHFAKIGGKLTAN